MSTSTLFNPDQNEKTTFYPPPLGTDVKVNLPPVSIEPNNNPTNIVTDKAFYLIMVSLWIGNFAAYFNEATATTSMHTIGEEFNDLSNQNWIATAYLIGFTVTQTLLGRFSDIFGRGAVFNGTMVIFAAGSVWCGLAQSMNSLIGGRFLQGIGAAGRQTVGVIIVIDLTTPETRGLWLGFYNLFISLGLAAGPVLGAILSVDATWRWIFWITLIMSGVIFLIGATSMHYPVPHRTQSNGLIAQLKEVDYVGSVLVMAIVSLISIAIELGNKEFPWKSAPIITLFVVAAALIPVFIFYELKVAKHPVVDMHLFTIRNIPTACLINFLTGTAYFGSIFFLPRYFIDIFGSDLVTAGVQMLGITLAVGVAAVFGANLISRSGQVRLIGAIGSTLYALGGALMFLVGRHTSGTTVIGFSILMGFGSGILFQPSLIVGPMSVNPHQVAGISGFLSFLRTLGGSFATPLLTSIYETSFTTALRGNLPKYLIDQGLGLADQHSKFPQYENAILDALVKAFHFGSVPLVFFGVLYLLVVIMLRDIDFVPEWRRTKSEGILTMNPNTSEETV